MSVGRNGVGLAEEEQATLSRISPHAPLEQPISIEDVRKGLTEERVAVLCEVLQLYLRCITALLRALVAVDQFLYCVRRQQRKSLLHASRRGDLIRDISDLQSLYECRCRQQSRLKRQQQKERGSGPSSPASADCSCWEYRSPWAKQNFQAIAAELNKASDSELASAAEELVDSELHRVSSFSSAALVG